MAITDGEWRSYRFLRDHKGVALHGVGVMTKIEGREVILCEAYPAPHPVAVNEDNMRVMAASKRMLTALLKIADGCGADGRWLDRGGNECAEDAEGAQWTEFTSEEQALWIESAGRLAREAIAVATGETEEIAI